MTSPQPSATELLRPGLLTGVSVLVVGLDRSSPASGGGGVASEPAPPGVAPGAVVREACVSLGARVTSAWPDAAEESVLDAAVEAAVWEAGGIDLLVFDGAGVFAATLADGASPHAALRACLDGAWNTTRAVVNRAFLQAAEPGGRIVYLAPPPDVGAHADAARAGLENLARTLSVEWARYRITSVTIAMGPTAAVSAPVVGVPAVGAPAVSAPVVGMPAASVPAVSAPAVSEVAALVAYLASPAGAYFSGCQLDLRGVPPIAHAAAPGRAAAPARP